MDPTKAILVQDGGDIWISATECTILFLTKHGFDKLDDCMLPEDINDVVIAEVTLNELLESYVREHIKSKTKAIIAQLEDQ